MKNNGHKFKLGPIMLTVTLLYPNLVKIIKNLSMSHLSATSKEVNPLQIEASIILAVRNEEGYIQRCLDSLISQDFPKNRYEIIVIDGESTDKTPEVLNEYQSKYPDFIKVFKNSKQTSGNGRNIGIMNSKGEYVVIFGGHSVAHPSFLSVLMKSIQESPSDVAGIGAVHKPAEDESFFGKVVAEVQSSLLGGVGTTFKPPSDKSHVDTVTFTIYKKAVLEKIGLHDIRFDVGQDIEINWRIRKSGYKLAICHDALVYYYRKHSSFGLLAKRMFKYGMWRARFIKKHPDSFRIQFAIPTLFVLSLISIPLVRIYIPLLSDLIISLAGIYGLAVIASSITISIKNMSLRYIIAVPMYPIEHISFGFGFLLGLLKKRL